MVRQRHQAAPEMVAASELGLALPARHHFFHQAVTVEPIADVEMDKGMVARTALAVHVRLYPSLHRLPENLFGLMERIFVDRSSLIDAALDRLQTAVRQADHTAKEYVTVKTEDLIDALRELDRSGVINLDLD